MRCASVTALPSTSMLAEEWVRRWSLDSRARIGLAPALDLCLPKEQPELCLDAVLEVLARVPHSSASPMLGALAAGPLENVLSWNGDAVIERVEMLARRDPGFRLLLNGVGGSGLKPAIVARLSKYRASPW